MNVKDKVYKLQQILKNNAWDAFMFSTTDEYINEYVPTHFQRLEYLTNFNGSFGFCIITQNKALIMVDSRYTIAVKQQVDASVFDIMDYNMDNISLFLQNNLVQNAKVTMNSKTLTIEELRLYTNILSKLNMELITIDIHLVDEIWTNRPSLSSASITDYHLSHAGSPRQDKIALLNKYLLNNNLEGYLITQLDNIAWLLNLRGMDVACNPIFLSQLLIRINAKPILFVNEAKFDAHVLNTIKEYVEIQPENTLHHVLSTYVEQHKIAIANNSPYYYVKLLNQVKSTNCIVIEDVVSNIKAIKNPTELKNTQYAHIRDASYIIKAIKYIHENLDVLDEISVANKIIELRSLDNKYKMESFPAIVGSNKNGAIVHYRADKDTNMKIMSDGYLLLDCGAQYLDGTTDITRSFCFKEDMEYKNNYTLVLKGHIGLAKAVFKYNTKGCEVDILARQYLWQQGKDYLHGTGHGVGVYLSVHELGAKVSSTSSVVFKEGMILSNEPGFYLENQYGIRLENLYFVKKSQHSGFLEFENLTYVPFDIKNIDFDDLDESELSWLDDYHKKVYQHAIEANILNQEELYWLKKYMNI